MAGRRSEGSKITRIEKGTPMRAARATILAALTVLSIPVAGAAQSPGEVFRKVTPSVVVIRAKGSEVTTGGQVRFTETGSGVLISADRKVMTAAHVVHSMNDISVEFLGGDIILSVEGVPAESAASMAKIRDHLATMRSGDSLKATVLRAGEVIDLTGVVP
jgi:S1-C subfamily serine protease